MKNDSNNNALEDNACRYDTKKAGNSFCLHKAVIVTAPSFNPLERRGKLGSGAFFSNSANDALLCLCKNTGLDTKSNTEV